MDMDEDASSDVAADEREREDTDDDIGGTKMADRNSDFEMNDGTLDDEDAGTWMRSFVDVDVGTGMCREESTARKLDVDGAGDGDGEGDGAVCAVEVLALCATFDADSCSDCRGRGDG